MKRSCFIVILLLGSLLALIAQQVGVPPALASLPTTYAVTTSVPTTAPTTAPTTTATTYPTTFPTTTATTLPDTPTPIPTNPPTTPPNSTPVWNASQTFSVQSGSGQCGAPTHSGTTFTFALSQNAGSCYRNQAMPNYGGYATAYLTAGATYQWTFTYRDSDANNAPPGMGPDKDARALVWQVHPNTCSCTPCTTLNFINGPNGVSSPEYWGFYDCKTGSSNVLEWSAPYVAGQSVQWKIEVTISNPQGTANGSDRLWMNGALVYSANNIVTTCCATNTTPYAQWWNFGPYKWIWANASNPSSMQKVNATFDAMTLVRLSAPSTPAPTSAPTTPPPSPIPSASAGAGGTALYGCPVFPANDWVYNKDISALAADPNSSNLIRSYLNYAGGFNAVLSISVGATNWFVNPSTNETQYPLAQVMASGTPAPAGKPAITDFPFSSATQWQGKAQTYSGDRHLMTLRSGSCIVYESYVSGSEPPATWVVGGAKLLQHSYYGARWNLAQPYPTASPRSGVNLGGMPQFAGMVRWEDYLHGSITHALNIQLKAYGFGGAVFPCTSRIPASNYHGTMSPPLPCGAHLRLLNSYVLKCTCPQAQMVVTAMKKYGLYFMDQGSTQGTIYFANYRQASGTWVQPWNISDIRNLGVIPMGQFAIVPPPGCASVAACVTYAGKQTAPLGLNPGICPFIPHKWRVQHKLLYRRLCHA